MATKPATFKSGKSNKSVMPAVIIPLSVLQQIFPRLKSKKKHTKKELNSLSARIVKLLRQSPAKMPKIKSFDDLRDWIMKNGLQKQVHEMLQLEGVNFSRAFLPLIEYFRPKLTREISKDKYRHIDMQTLPADIRKRIAAIPAGPNVEKQIMKILDEYISAKTL